MRNTQNNAMSIRTVKYGAQWTIREGYDRLTDMIKLEDFGSSLYGNRYRLIKVNKVRSVFSMPGNDISGNGIYIKCFKNGGYRDCIKYLFVPTRARTEWEVGNALLGKDINTALPLAMAEKRKFLLPDSGFLVTEAVTNSEDFMQFCQTNYEGVLSWEKEAEKKKLLGKLADFVRDIHEKGFYHYDLHAGNILIRFNNSLSPSARDCSLYLMDLHSVKILKRMSVKKRLYNLAQIFNSLSSILTKADKSNFVISYGFHALCNTKHESTQYKINASPLSSHSQGVDGNMAGESNNIPQALVPLLVEKIDAQSLRIRKIHYRSRLKRCLKKSSSFSRKRVAGMRMFFRNGYNTDSLAGLVERHNKALASDDKTVIIKRDAKTALTRSVFMDDVIKSVVIKQYKTSQGLNLLRNLFRKSAGRKAWIAGNGLLVYGFSAPKPLALVEKTVLGVTADSYLVMEDVKDGLEMDRYILKHFHNHFESTQLKERNHPISSPFQKGDLTNSPPHLQGAERGEVKSLNKILLDREQLILSPDARIKKKRLFISGFAKALSLMHNHNIFHHDLKTCNIMVKEEGDKSFNFFFLDFDKVSFEEDITIQTRVKNLTQINLSTPTLITLTDRFRFLKEYLKQCGVTGEKRIILRKIINLSRTEKILYVSFHGDVTENW